MPHSGQKCETSGIYSGKCISNGAHVKEIALSKGDTFPPCNTAGTPPDPSKPGTPACSGVVLWALKQATK